MAKHIYFDKTELVVWFPEGKKYKSLNLTYDQVTRVQIEKCTEFRFFRKVPSEKILIFTNKRGNPIEYTRYKEKKYFDEYKEGLVKFTRDNRITFIDNTKEQQESTPVIPL